MEHFPPVGTADTVEGIPLQFLRGQLGQARDTARAIYGAAIFTDDQHGVSIRAEPAPLKKL